MIDHHGEDPPRLAAPHFERQQHCRGLAGVCSRTVERGSVGGCATEGYRLFARVSIGMCNGNLCVRRDALVPLLVVAHVRTDHLSF